MIGRRTVLGGALALTLAGLGAVQLIGTAPPARADGLVAFDHCEELLEHYRDQLTEQHEGSWSMVPTFQLSMSAASASAQASDSSGGAAIGPGATGTNVQEGGVDEPDVAKLADGRIVTLTAGHLSVVTAEHEPRLLGSVRVEAADQGQAGELLLLGDRALVVGNAQRWYAARDGKSSSGFAGESPTTTVTLVDLSVPTAPRVLERAAYNGSYVSARMVGDTVRVVTAHTPAIPWVYPERPGKRAERRAKAANEALVERLTVEAVLPQRVQVDPVSGEILQGPSDAPVPSGPAVACSDVRQAPGSRGTTATMVTTLRPGDGLSAADTTVVSAAGDMVYAAEDRMYLATSRWNAVSALATDASLQLARSGGTSTELHAFDTSVPGETAYVASGSVPGYLVNRWALSRHEGVLRVATTLPPTVEELSSSMVLKLDERDGELVESGRVAGLGRTEVIKSVRYLGDVAAVVTFRQTDPLYLVDLAAAPKVLGELKVPGFSTYLHPIGDDLLLGVGQDADSRGFTTGTQVSVFDASDRSAPKLVDRLTLGPGWSTALDESRAFTYDPVRRTVVIDYFRDDGRAEVVGVQVDADGGLREVGRAAVPIDYYGGRALAGEDRYFAVGGGEVTVLDPAGMVETASLKLTP